MLKWSVTSIDDRPANRKVSQYQPNMSETETEDKVSELPKFRPRNYLGSDPRAATCRGKLQSKRSKLNMEINKELRLRHGAENLYRATSDPKTKETVSLELRFVNSNLQLLKEQLAELNSSMEVYQNSDKVTVMPMIPLGLKETNELELRNTLKDFIKEHYYEDGEDYEDAVAELMDLRQAIRTPSRDSHGISLLFQYYNQLHFVERRFYSPDRQSSLFYEWYDSLTGVPCTQKTVAFEKACVLFNIGGLYTQIGTRQDRSSPEGLDCAVDNFLRAAGTFQFIIENFSNAPSSDLGPDCVNMLVQLMLAQARECLFEKGAMTLEEGDMDDMETCLELAQEAAHLSNTYDEVLISVPECIPYTWVCLIQIKREHYRALADYYVSLPLSSDTCVMNPRVQDTFQFLHDLTGMDEADRPAVPRSDQQKRYLAKAHLREALLMHEESLRVNRMCQDMKNKDALQSVIKHFHDRSLGLYELLEDEDDFQELFSPPPVQAATKYQLNLSYPDFSHHKVSDLFRQLGPEAVFSAKHDWAPARTVHLTKTQDNTGFGFSVRGGAPVVVVGVEPGSLADMASIREGDYIVSIMDRDTKWCTHDQVVSMISEATSYLRLSLVSPIKPWNKYKPNYGDSVSSKDKSSVSSSSSSSTNIIRVFTPSSSRTSFSSMSSTSSKDSDRDSGSLDNNNRQRKKTWAVLQIKSIK